MSLSTLTAAPAATLANGIATSALVVTDNDADRQPIRSGSSSMSSSASGVTFVPSSGTTDANGRFTSLVKGTKLARGHTAAERHSGGRRAEYAFRVPML